MPHRRPPSFLFFVYYGEEGLLDHAGILGYGAILDDIAAYVPVENARHFVARVGEHDGGVGHTLFVFVAFGDLVGGCLVLALDVGVGLFLVAFFAVENIAPGAADGAYLVCIAQSFP